MVDSMNARRGTNAQLKQWRAEIREKYNLNKINICTTDYFKHFDENDVKTMHYKQEEYLRTAAEVAMNSMMNHKHGAVIVHKKNIIATGYNYHYCNHSIHAEIAAISQLKGKEKEILPECELYVVRIGSNIHNHPLKYSKPCTNCQNYIAKKCIKRTFYSTNYEFDELIAHIIE
jgi:deoxycytidylate deaminase